MRTRLVDAHDADRLKSAAAYDLRDDHAAEFIRCVHSCTKAENMISCMGLVVLCHRSGTMSRVSNW